MHCASLSYPLSLIRLPATSPEARGSPWEPGFLGKRKSDTPACLLARFEMGCRYLESREGKRLRTRSDQPVEGCLWFPTMGYGFAVEEQPAFCGQNLITRSRSWSFMPSGSSGLIESGCSAGTSWSATGVSGGRAGDAEGGEARVGAVLGLRGLLKRPHRKKPMTADGRSRAGLYGVQTEVI